MTVLRFELLFCVNIMFILVYFQVVLCVFLQTALLVPSELNGHRHNFVLTEIGQTSPPFSDKLHLF